MRFPVHFSFERPKNFPILGRQSGCNFNRFRQNLVRRNRFIHDGKSLGFGAADSLSR